MLFAIRSFYIDAYCAICRMLQHTTSHWREGAIALLPLVSCVDFVSMKAVIDAVTGAGISTVSPGSKESIFYYVLVFIHFIWLQISPVPDEVIAIQPSKIRKIQLAIFFITPVILIAASLTFTYYFYKTTTG